MRPAPRCPICSRKCAPCTRSAVSAPLRRPAPSAVSAHAPPADRGSGQRTYSERSLHGRIAHRIGMQILRGELPAGRGLPSEDLWSAELEVSRTALREAIKVLAAKGLIESRPRTGARVCARERWNFLDPDVLAWRLAALPTERYVRDLFDLRQVIEPSAARSPPSGPAKRTRAARPRPARIWRRPVRMAIRGWRRTSDSTRRCCG